MDSQKGSKAAHQREPVPRMEGSLLSSSPRPNRSDGRRSLRPPIGSNAWASIVTEDSLKAETRWVDNPPWQGRIAMIVAAAWATRHELMAVGSSLCRLVLRTRVLELGDEASFSE